MSSHCDSNCDSNCDVVIDVIDVIDVIEIRLEVEVLNLKLMYLT